jgi:hypothetical protein
MKVDGGTTPLPIGGCVFLPLVLVVVSRGGFETLGCFCGGLLRTLFLRVKKNK